MASLSRRELIKRLGLGMATGMAFPWLSACTSDDPAPAKNTRTVAIVGAGAAGLYAADILLAQGLNVVILEASNRYGGRVQSLQTNEQPSSSLIYDPANLPNPVLPFELGADQVIGNNSLWYQEIQRLKLSVQNVASSVSGNGLIINDGFHLADPPGDNASFSQAKSFLESLHSYNAANISLAEAVDQAGVDPSMHSLLNAWISNKHGTVNERLGIYEVAHANNRVAGNRDLYLLQQNPMQNALLARFNRILPYVQLNKAIQLIDYSGDKVILTDANGQAVEADQAIITVPIAVLKTGDISFTPSLPSEKTMALDNIGMDAAVRVILEFRQNFWGNDIGFIYGGVTVPEFFNTGLNSAANRFLNATVYGPSAEALSLMGGNMIDAVLEQLDLVFDGAATANIRRTEADVPVVIIKDWTKDPFIRGGISYLRPGGNMEDRSKLAQPVGDKLFFAGEATDVTGEAGTVSGALLSGRRAAEEVIEAVRRNTSS